MPRVRALFLLGLFVVNQAACTTWQVPSVTPQEYVTQHPDAKVRVTAKDEQGVWSPGAGVVLAGARFSADSVSGRGPEDQPIAFSLRRVVTIEVRRVSGAATGFLLVSVGLIAVGVASVSALNNMLEH